MEEQYWGKPSSGSFLRNRIMRVLRYVVMVSAVLVVVIVLGGLFAARLSINFLNVGGNLDELPETGVAEIVKDVWINEAGDTLLGDLVFYNANLHLGPNSIVTAASDISSQELDLLNEGIDYDEIIGYLKNDKFSAKSDLEEEGYLNNDEGGDILTRDQADNRFIISGETGTILSAMIVDGSITAEDLAENAITSIELADGSVTTAEILDGSITGSKIDDGAIVAVHIADDSIITAKILDGAITGAKLSDGSIGLSKLSESMCSPGEYLQKTSLTSWSCVPGSGSMGSVSAGDGLSNSGDASNLILDVNVDGSTIEIVTDTLRIADGAITSAKLDDGSITVNKIVAGAVVEGKLGNGAVTQIKLANNSVTTAKIVDGTISFADIAQNSCGANQIIKWNGAAWACADDVDTDTHLSEAEVENYIFDNDNTGTLESGTLALDSLTYSGTLDDEYVADDLTISDSGTISDGALSSNVSLLGASISKDELSGTGVLGFSWNTSELALTVMIEGENVSSLNNDAGYLTSYTETDPIFIASDVYDITDTDQSNWDTAYGWGDHSTAGYITDGNTNWDNSYGFITASSSETLTNKSGNISMWTNDSGYLTSYSETDPVFVASDVYDITDTDQSNWDTAYGWGDHSTEGYITDDTSVPKNHLVNSGVLSFTWSLGELISTVMAEGENISLLNNNSGYITDGNTNWDNSYGFITASSAETLTNKSGNISMWTNDSGYLTSYSETDPQVGANTTNYVPKWNGTSLVSGSIFDSGNVGIGTTSPSAPLHVQGTPSAGNNYALLKLQTTQTGAAAFSLMTAQDANGATLWSYGDLWSASTNVALTNAQSGGQLQFSTLTGTGAEITFRPRDTEAMRISTDGNVGIGTTSPGGLLGLSDANTYITVDGSNNLTFTDAVTGTKTLAELTAGGTSYWTQTGSNIYYATGNVGIGTNDPQQLLHVYNASGQADIKIQSPNDNTTQLRFVEYVGGSGDYGGLIRYDGANNVFRFGSIEDGSSTFALNIPRGSGNVGIGTTSPDTTLDIITGDSSEGIRLSQTADDVTAKYANIYGRPYDNSDGDWMMFMGYASSGSNSARFGGGTSLANAATELIFYTAADTTTTKGTERLVIDNTGKVGIGTTAPQDLLDLRGGSVRIGSGSYSSTGNMGATTYLAISDDTITNTRAIQFFSADGTYNPRVVIKHVTATNDHYLQFDSTFSSGTGYADWIFSNGNVGIGTTAPGVELEVGTTSKASNTEIRALAGDSNNAGFEAYGASQGTGYLYVGQSSGYGGGVYYNGDASPAFASGEYADRITFYRKEGGANSAVFSYPYNSSTVYFAGDLNIASGNITGANGEYIDIGNGANGDIRFHTDSDSTDYIRFDLDTDSYPEIRGYRNGAEILMEFPTGLYVSGSTLYAANTAYLRNGVYDDGGPLYLTGEDSVYINMDGNNDDADTNAIIFAKNSTSTSGTELMRIKENGYVGMGTSNPNYPLEVVTNWSNGGHVASFTNTSTATTAYSYLGVGNNTQSDAFLLGILGGNYGGAGDANNNKVFIWNRQYGAIEFGTNNSARFKIGRDGGFTLNGSMGSASGGGQVLRVNTSTWEMYRDTSSLRYKHDVTDLETDSSKIYDLRPVSFTYNNDNYRDDGLIAEEVYPFLPKLVSLDAEGRPDGVQYDRLPVLLLNEMIKNKNTLDRISNKVESSTIFSEVNEDYLSKIDQIIADYDEGLLTGSVASIPSDLVVNSVQAQVGTFTQLSGETLSVGNGSLEVDALGNVVTIGDLTAGQLFSDTIEVREIIAKHEENIGVVLGDSDGMTEFTISDSDGNPLVVVDSEGNVTIGQNDFGSKLKVEGYLQLDYDVEKPQDSECDELEETGKTFYQSDVDVLWICQGEEGWQAH